MRMSRSETPTMKQIRPTGSPWVISDADPATVPVPLQTVIVKIEGPYTERDRKLWVFLLHSVFDELGEKPIHSLPVRDISAVFRDLGGDHNTEWLWESARRLAKTTVEWETTFGDDRFVQGIAALFGANISREAQEMATLDFFFPPNLIPIIKQPRRFARLRVHFLLKLSGKYAVTLYEILEGFSNRRDGECRVTIENLRAWLKVPKGSYATWKNFRLRVLDPAVKQINDDPYGAGFSVEYEPIRRGRSYHEIVFKLTKAGQRVEQEKSIQQAKGRKERIAQFKAKGRPYLSETEIDKAARETGYYLDMKQVEREFWQYWEAEGKPELENVGGAFMGFTKRKYKTVKFGRS